MKKLYLILPILFLAVVSNAQQNIKKGEIKSSTSVKIQKTPNSQNQNSFFSVKDEKYLKFNTEEFRTQNNIPADFPVYRKTEDLKTGIETFEKTLKQWIEKNPAKYAEIKDIINF